MRCAASAGKFPLDETNQMQLTLIEAAAYFQKDDLARGTQLLDTEISRNPTNNALLATATQFFVAKGLYTNALKVINSRLRDLPDDPDWLFSKSYVYLQLKDYDKAIPVLSQVLSQQADNTPRCSIVPLPISAPANSMTLSPTMRS